MEEKKIKARRVSIKCQYNSKDISTDIAAFFKSFSIREVMSDEADSAEITLQDRDELWQGDWLSDRGAMMLSLIHI